MSTKLASAYLEISANTQNLKGDLNNARGQLNSFVQDVVAMWGQIKGSLIGLGLIQWGVKQAAEAETMANAMNTVIKDIDKTTELMEDLRKFSDFTPFTPAAIMKSSRLLVSFGSEISNVQDELKMLGDLASGSGSNLPEIAMIFSQIRGEGKLMTQDFRQLATRGINLRKQLVQDLGITEDQFKDLMGTGQISFAAVKTAMQNMTNEGGTFANAMANASETINGRLSTMQGRFQTLGKTLGEAVEPALSMAIELLIRVADGFKYLDEETGGWLATIVAGVVIVGSITLAVSALSVAISLLSAKMKANAGASAIMSMGWKLAKLAGAGLAVYLGTRFVLYLAGGAGAMAKMTQATKEMKEASNGMAELHAKRAQETIKESQAFETNADKIEFLTAQIARNRLEMNGAEKSMNSFKNKVKEADTAYNSFSSMFGIDNMKDEQALLDDARGSYEAFEQNVKTLTEEMERLKKADQEKIKAIEDEKIAAAKELADAIQAEVDAVAQKNREYGKSEEQLTMMRLAELGATDEVIQATQAHYDNMAALEAEAQATERYRQAKENAKNTLNQLMKSLTDQNARLGMSQNEWDLHIAKVNGATAAQLNWIKSLQKSIAVKKEEAKAANDSKSFADSIKQGQKSEIQKYADQIDKIEDAVRRGDLTKQEGERAAFEFYDAFKENIEKGLVKVEASMSGSFGLTDFNKQIQDMVNQDQEKRLQRQQLEEQVQQKLQAMKANGFLQTIADRIKKLGST